MYIRSRESRVWKKALCGEGFSECTTLTQRRREFTKFSMSRDGEGSTRKNANWIVFASKAAKLDLLLGVCLISETFYGYSKLRCWIDLAQPGSLWKVFILDASEQRRLHETLPCLCLLCALGSSYHKLSMHNVVARSCTSGPPSGLWWERSRGTDGRHQVQE